MCCLAVICSVIWLDAAPRWHQSVLSASEVSIVCCCIYFNHSSRASRSWRLLKHLSHLMRVKMTMSSGKKAYRFRHFLLKLKECGVTFPDTIVACRLIKSCNLSDVHFQLAISATPAMMFKSMKSTLLKLFSRVW